ncbi:MAG: class I SAM-dependent methyltransferase [Nitrososphaerales archaeon]
MYYKGKKVDGPLAPGNDFHSYGNRIRAELSTRVPKNRKIKVLDVGTGFGSAATFLAKHLAKGSKVWTVDPSKEILDNAREKLSQEGVLSRISIEFVQADAAKLEFENDFFDTIVSIMVLHHIENLGAVVGELVRVLKKGGRLLLVDYAPKAGKKLEFLKRHHESDFFEPIEVMELIKQAGVSKAKLSIVKLWYLADATK